jgi:SOS-response transcriptional repressor LexA
MENPIRTRVIARLDALGLTASSDALSKRLTAQGLNKTYLYDFVAGVKNSLRMSNLPAEAKALDCSVEYLLSGEESSTQTSRKPRRNKPKVSEEIEKLPEKTSAAMRELSGICEAGTWRETQPTMPLPVRLPTDSRFPIEDQRAYLVHGDHAEKFGIGNGSIIVIATTAPARAGDVVVVTRHRGTETEISVTRFENAPGDSKVAGVVLFNFRTF